MDGGQFTILNALMIATLIMMVLTGAGHPIRAITLPEVTWERVEAALSCSEAMPDQCLALAGVY